MILVNLFHSIAKYILYKQIGYAFSSGCSRCRKMRVKDVIHLEKIASIFFISWQLLHVSSLLTFTILTEQNGNTY